MSQLSRIARPSSVSLLLSVAAAFTGAAFASADEPAGSPAEYVLRTYDVSDLIIRVQDHPYSGSAEMQQNNAASGGGIGGGGFGGGGGGGLGSGNGGGGGGLFSVPNKSATNARNRTFDNGAGNPVIRLAQTGAQTGGGMGGGGNPGAPGGAGAPAVGTITIDEIIDTVVNTVEPDSWEQSGGGAGKIHELGTVLIVWQLPGVHEKIEKFLQAIQHAAGRAVVSVDARWLMLDSNDLERLLGSNHDAPPKVDPQALSEFTRRSTSIRGATTCFSGQLVYLVSGTQRNFVSGYIPVVGALGDGEAAGSLVSSRQEVQIQFAQYAQSQSQSPQREHVGYQPIVVSPNIGAVLEIRPTMMRGGETAVVDLHATISALGEKTPEVVYAPGSESMAPAVERFAIDTQELATTLRLPVKTPVLVGGLTYIPHSPDTNPTSPPSGSDSERPQLYLVLEIR